nr:LysR family transcriptional regulator [Escherichia coli]
MFISDETIRIIHLVARHQNITTAAEQLNKVPSTISYTLKKAEETLGVELFIRKGRYIELSPAGVTSSNIAKIFSAIWMH